MTSKKRTQKLLGYWSWLVEANFPRGTSNQKHYADLCIHMSSVSNFYVRSSEILSRANQCRHREMLVVFSGCSSDPYLRHGIFYILLTINVSSCIFSQAHSRKCHPSLRPTHPPTPLPSLRGVKRTDGWYFRLPGPTPQYETFWN